MLSSEVWDILVFDEKDGDICWRDCVVFYDNDVLFLWEFDLVRWEFVWFLDIVVFVIYGFL